MWQTEEQFVGDFQHLVAGVAAPRWRMPFVWREERTGYGQPDILLLDACPTVLGERAAHCKAIPPIGRAAASAMTYLHGRRWVSVDTMTQRTRLSPMKALAALDQLEVRGLVLRRRDSVRARPVGECLAIRRVVAVEAKLRAWRRAVVQARRHLWFAQASYILLAHTSDTLAPRVAAECRDAGIGLIVPEVGGHARVVVRPTVAPLHQTYLAWLLNERLVDAHASTLPN